ncbi:hypothetical protein FRB95_005297 [Tulasnella sp. JGI-2019a]|nr:hypothetical protein FRB95_005297 [Tulasnella sp. JGI-2019a]
MCSTESTYPSGLDTFANAAPSIDSSGLVSVPSKVSSFSSAPEYAQMMDMVKAAIRSINEIIGLLDNPKVVEPKLSDCIYALATIRAFKIRCIECDHSLENVSATASAWFFSVSTRLADVNKELAQVQGRIRGVEEEIVTNLQSIEQSIKSIFQAVPDVQEEDKLDGRLGPDQDATQVQTIMSWMPFIASALTIAEVSKDDEDMCCADRNTLMELVDGLRDCRQQGLRLKAEIESIKVTEAEIIALQLRLRAITLFLGPLKINIEQCIRAVRGGFALSGLTGRVENGSMGMGKARVAIKSLADSLELPDSYWGIFITLSEEGCAEFDERIKALRNKEKKPVPVALPEPVETPQVPPVSATAPEPPVPTTEPPQISEPKDGPQQPQVPPPIQTISVPTYYPPVSPSVAPVTPVGFNTALVSPINGWDLVGVHLAKGVNGKADSQFLSTPSTCLSTYGRENGTYSIVVTVDRPYQDWEVVSMHLVRPTVGYASCCSCHGSQTQSIGAGTAVSSPVTNAPLSQTEIKGNNPYVDTASSIPNAVPQAPISAPSGEVDVNGKNETLAVSDGPVPATSPMPQTPARRSDGYFSQTSKNIRLDGSILQADCLGPDDQTYQSSSLDINEILGNDNGSFTFRFGGWSMSAGNISLDGAVLTADLRYTQYGWNYAQKLDLDRHIANDGGVLKLVNTSV